MKLNHKELITVYGGNCIICSIINGLKRILQAINIRHLMNHLFVD